MRWTPLIVLDLAVPSDATAQRKRLRHHARLKMRQLLKSQPDGQSIRRLVVEGTSFVEIAKFARGEGIDPRSRQLWGSFR